MAFPAWMSGFCPAMFRATFDCPGSSDTVRFFTTMVGLRLASIGFFSGGRLAKVLLKAPSAYSTSMFFRFQESIAFGRSFLSKFANELRRFPVVLEFPELLTRTVVNGDN
ncbi:unnamed protein product [Arabidopsis thaliana]|uniref:Uncharacterized protein n=2 Tax=Arabidopsis thaliana TaxID=3702 RepID=A0A5S9WLY4_ARATH|nr:unnamed protein product [Arabidopsis thaliana]